jgi:predicted ArsR family transcriptional regulator
MKKIDKDEITAEEWYNLEKRFLIEGFLVNSMALLENLGSKGTIEALRPHARNSGNAFTINMQKIFKIEGSNIEKISMISQLWDMLSNASLAEQDVEENEDKIIRAGFVNCVYRSGPREICTMHQTAINGICEAIDPEFECRFMQMLPNGDPMCSYIIEKKKK